MSRRRLGPGRRITAATDFAADGSTSRRYPTQRGEMRCKSPTCPAQHEDLTTASSSTKSAPLPTQGCHRCAIGTPVTARGARGLRL
jgi:hypothetical protein